MNADAALSLRDYISGAAFLLSLAIWVRTLLRERTEPRRTELRALLDLFETEVEDLTAEMERHLLYLKERLDRVEIMRRLRKLEKLFNKLEARLGETHKKDFRKHYSNWSRALTNDPFPVQNQKGKLQPGDLHLQLRKDKEEKLAESIDLIRRAT